MPCTAELVGEEHWESRQSHPQRCLQFLPVWGWGKGEVEGPVPTNWGSGGRGSVCSVCVCAGMGMRACGRHGGMAGRKYAAC